MALVLVGPVIRCPIAGVQRSVVLLRVPAGRLDQRHGVVGAQLQLMVHGLCPVGGLQGHHDAVAIHLGT